MSAREDILDRIGKGLSAGANKAARQRAVEARINEHPRSTIPARGQLDLEGRIALLKDMLEGQSASISELEHREDIPAEIANYCRNHNLGPSLRIGENPVLDALDWKRANLETSSGKADAQTPLSCSTAFCAIAETGTLMLLSGPANPATLNYLPDNHIIIINSDDVLASYEEGWDKLRLSGSGIPRTINYISGPSRTADIEQTIFLGAHGPRRLHVVIVK